MDARPVAFCNGDFKYFCWEKDFPVLAKEHINYKQAMAIIHAVCIWVPQFSNRTLLVYSDNTCAVSIINKASCKNELIMAALRNMFWISPQ